MVHSLFKDNTDAVSKWVPIAILLIVYFFCRLFFQQLTAMKMGFIFPTGMVVEMFYGAGEFVGKEWLFGIENTKFVLGESCSGTTFFSLLFAFIAYRIKKQNTPYFWLLLAYPITIIANAMRVLSSIYAHNFLSTFNALGLRDEVHVVTGVMAFLCSFLIVVYVIESTNRQVQNEY